MFTPYVHDNRHLITLKIVINKLYLYITGNMLNTQAVFAKTLGKPLKINKIIE